MFVPDSITDGRAGELNLAEDTYVLQDSFPVDGDSLGEPDAPQLDVNRNGDGDSLVDVCQPQCGDRECGLDGCGAKCGFCSDGAVCISGYCLEPSGDFGPSSFINELAVGPANCCFDLDGDGLTDNGLEALLSNIAPLLQDTDPNVAVKAFVEDGRAPVLIEFDGVDNWNDDLDVVLHFIVGTDADDDFTDNLSPDVAGVFLADADYLDESGQPLMALDSAVISGGLLQAQAAQLKAYVPISEELGFDLIVEQVVAEATVSSSEQGGVSLGAGKLGGLIRSTVLFDGLNGYIAGECSCLGLSDGLIVDGQCATDGNNEDCNDEDEDACGLIYGACDLALTFIQFDIDTDDDGLKDAISVGLEFAGLPALIAGIAP